jgi:hypothetical protein
MSEKTRTDCSLVGHISIWPSLVNLLGEKVNAVKETTSFLVANKEFFLEVNAEEAKNTFMSREHNAGQNHVMKPTNKSF